MTHSLGSINLLEQLGELRELFHLLGHWLIIKGYNSGMARWKRCRGQGGWEEVSLHGIDGLKQWLLVTEWKF